MSYAHFYEAFEQTAYNEASRGGRGTYYQAGERNLARMFEEQTRFLMDRAAAKVRDIEYIDFDGNAFVAADPKDAHKLVDSWVRAWQKHEFAAYWLKQAERELDARRREMVEDYGRRQREEIRRYQDGEL